MKIIKVERVDGGVRADVEVKGSFFSVLIKRDKKSFEIDFINDKSEISTVLAKTGEILG